MPIEEIRNFVPHILKKEPILYLAETGHKIDGNAAVKLIGKAFRNDSMHASAVHLCACQSRSSHASSIAQAPPALHTP
jgi:hypothetical protein